MDNRLTSKKSLLSERNWTSSETFDPDLLKQETVRHNLMYKNQTWFKINYQFYEGMRRTK